MKLSAGLLKRRFRTNRLVAPGVGFIALALVSAMAWPNAGDGLFGSLYEQSANAAELAQVRQGQLVADGDEAPPAEADAAPTPSALTFDGTPFAISDPAFVTYFRSHGGLAAFGYPITNSFRFLGFETQIFQRVAVQKAPDGKPQLMNLLDADVMPYTRVNGSTFPEIDPELQKLAPKVTDADYVPRMLAFIRAEVPDTFAGQPVGFLQTFESTMPCNDPDCTEDMRLQANFDLWGPPTSEPRADPNNPQFIYQRFQRGIMHYDAGCGCTQAVLLGEYFKALLAGLNLPQDLQQEAQTSALFGATALGLADSDFSGSGIPVNADLQPVAQVPPITSAEPALRPLPIEVGTTANTHSMPSSAAPVTSVGGGGGGGGGPVGIVSTGGGGGTSHAGGSHSSGGGSSSQVAADTATPTPTSQIASPATSTPSPTPTPWSNPTSTATPRPTSTPTAGFYCSQAIHDKYVVAGPDGRMYPTWHPPVDPETGCLFGHEHGADPRTSRANPAMPPFGYAAAQMGMVEPHEGFKLFVLNSGDRADDGRILHADYRIVFHMGTSGVGRYTQQFHSVIYDYVAQDGSGRYAHVQGMADTAATGLDGSTCDLPRKGGKDFSTVGCDDAYEIWGFAFAIMHPNDPYQDPQHVRLYVSGSVAAFDPILTRDPSDNNRVLYTQAYRGDSNGNNRNVDPLSPKADYQGCQREAYGGPNYWDNAGNATTYYTDAMGHVVNGPGTGAIQQQVSAVNSTSNEIYKIRHDYCGNGIHAPN